MTKLFSVMGCEMAVLRIAVDGWMGGCNCHSEDYYGWKTEMITMM